MKILFLIIGLFFAYADPFDYGDVAHDEGLNLYGLMKDKANFNGKWRRVQTSFEAQNTRFKILKIDNHCVLLEESSTQNLREICLQKSKLLRN